MMWINRGLDDHARKRKRRGTMRFALGALLAFMLIGSMAIGTSAQKEAGCDDISADLAQVRLEQNPSYARGPSSTRTAMASPAKTMSLPGGIARVPRTTGTNATVVLVRESEAAAGPNLVEGVAVKALGVAAIRTL
jgi:hypothetical protein